MDSAGLDQYRSNKDEYFRTSAHSPLDPDDRAAFRGLQYFPHRPDLVFTTELTAGDGGEVVVSTSDGAERVYRRAGTVDLPVGDTTIRLTLFDTGHSGYFLPFRDATSGRQTYGAGRYVDIPPSQGHTVTIDFNLAYNPFCAYRDGYSCALPPTENWLSVPIEAGERTYERGDH